MKEVQVTERRYYYGELDKVPRVYVDSILRKDDRNKFWYDHMGRPIVEIDKLDIELYGSPNT